MNTFKKWLAYSTAVTLMTATLGLSTLGEKEQEIVHAASNTQVELPVTIETASVNTTDKLNKINKVVEEKKRLELELEKKRLAEEKKRLDNISKFHQVSSEYLNVRKSTSTNSQITDVLVKGYIVEIDGEVNNGWVKLKSGGYVNAKYITHLKDKVSAEKKFKTQKKQTPVFTVKTPKVKSTSTTPQTVTSDAKATPVSTVSATGILAPSNVSAETMESVLSGTNLAGIGSALVQVEQQYGINAFFTLAVAKLESGNGSSRIALDKNNLFGMNAVDSNPYNAAFSYPSKSDSVLDFGHRLHKNYISQGLTTLELINTKYSSSSAWASKVRTIMSSDVNKVTY